MPTHSPTVAERDAGTCSVITRSPPGRTLRLTTAPSGVDSSVRVVPTGCSCPETCRAMGSLLTNALKATMRAPRSLMVAFRDHYLQRSETCSGVGLLGVGGRRGTLGGSLVVLDHDQADLAAVVDVGDLDAELVAHVDHVFDLVDPLAVAQLRDVHQAVLARQQRDERAERGRLHHGAEEALADLGQLRV